MKIESRQKWGSRLILLLTLAGGIHTPLLASPSSGQAVAADVKHDFTGTIVDADTDEPLIGASVKVKGANIVGVTDLDGMFTLKVSPGTELTVSYVGYKNKTVKIGNETSLTIRMETDASALDEVVVVGYGTQKKATLTGSVETVKADALQDRAVTNIGTALQGQTPGLVVTRSGSRPGNEGLNMQIRGATSINGGSPLIIIDGVPALNTQAFQNLNMDDVENISVLKDGAASIYGSKAANGVILVTTKKGSGKLSVNYNMNLRWNRVGRTDFAPDMKVYAQMFLEANKEDAVPNWWNWLTEENLQRMARGEEGMYTTAWGDIFLGNSNRMKELFSTQMSQQHNFSVAGSGEKYDYRLSLEYADNRSNLATAYDGQRQLNLRFNNSYKLTNWLRLQTSASMIQTRTSSPTCGIDGTMYGNEPPLFPAKNPYGQWYAMFGVAGGRQAVAATSDGGRNNAKRLITRVDVTAIADIYKGLSFEGTVSLQNQQYDVEKYRTPVQTYTWYGEPVAEMISSTTQQIQDENNPDARTNSPGYYVRHANDTYQYYSGILKYHTTLWEDHRIDVMAGINAEKWKSTDSRMAREIFEDNGVYDINLATGKQATSGGKSNSGTYSYIAKINYGYANKYLVELMGRRDGNSKFAKKNRFKNFGSASLGWVFSQEKFMEGLNPWFNFGKIRLSYGGSGNDNGAGGFEYLSLLATGDPAYFGENAETQVVTILNNSGLTTQTNTWETVTQKNAGIDLGFFNNRLTTSFDYFIKDNNHMLTSVTYPAVLGATMPKTNSGHLNVKGWEFQIGWRDNIRDFHYNVSFNIGDTKSHLSNIEGADTYVAGKNGRVNGYPLNSFFLYRTAGYFKDQAEVDRYYELYGSNGGAMAKVGKGTLTQLRPGDTKRVDLNGDGVITDAGSAGSDLQFVGDANPHYVFGINLGFEWNGIDFSTFLQGVGKQYIMRTRWQAYPFATTYTNQNPSFLGDTWTETHTDARYPRLTTRPDLSAWNYLNNDLLLQNNRYIRMKSLVIGYTLPQKWTRKIFLEKVRVYFAGDDLWEWSSIKDGFDPEMGEVSETAGYPFARTFSFGLNVTF